VLANDSSQALHWVRTLHVVDRHICSTCDSAIEHPFDAELCAGVEWIICENQLTQLSARHSIKCNNLKYDLLHAAATVPQSTRCVCPCPPVPDVADCLGAHAIFCRDLDTLSFYLDPHISQA
jgi:hypothetical protein